MSIIQTSNTALLKYSVQCAYVRGWLSYPASFGFDSDNETLENTAQFCILAIPPWQLSA